MNEELRQVLFRTVPFLLLIGGIAIALKLRKLTPADLYLRRPDSWARLWAWWALFLLFIFLVEVVSYKAGVLKVGQWSNTFFPSVLKILGIVVFAPIAEELAFRGAILSQLRRRKINKHLAIVLQALIFTALHSAAFNFSLEANLGKLQLFSDAVLFAYAMYHTKSIYTPMIMHATGNLVAVVEQFIL